jgi:hypothetical protein
MSFWAPEPEREPASSHNLEPAVRLLKPGVVQVDADVTGTRAATDFFYLLYGAFGHGIYM